MNRLYNILNALATKANKAPFVVRTATGTINRWVGGNVQLTAPTVEGYTFVMWIATTPNGWGGVIQPGVPTNNPEYFYVQYSNNPEGTGTITAYALYRAN